jgi:hypothetical protein
MQMKAVGKQSIVATARLLIETQGDDEQFDIAEIMMLNMLNQRQTKRNLDLLEAMKPKPVA